MNDLPEQLKQFSADDPIIEESSIMLQKIFPQLINYQFGGGVLMSDFRAIGRSVIVRDSRFQFRMVLICQSCYANLFGFTNVDAQKGWTDTLQTGTHI